MQIDISFRHMDPSDTLRDYADEKIRRVIRKHIRDDFDAQITLAVEKLRHIAKLHLSYKGISIKCEESSEDMYKSIDLALDKLERQIHTYKGKLRSRKPADVKPARMLDISVVELPKEEEEIIPEDIEVKDVPEVEAEKADAKIIKHETIALVEMSLDDAAMKLSLEDLPVLVFVNADTKATNVLYKLEDGKCGLIALDK
ncbi:MAG: ribosome-associated translation inhibitor RaiA [Proteobacteria bacterium]|nr:ribosome-associated translation inhibitor RaiA [Pseudomonadota bacterium]MBQ4360438.1 ribosome-associated translation inhibitor RaiA [Pseudomonadota bacterium]